MKKPDIARRMAREAKVTEGEAADRLDRVVHQILSKLKEGKAAPLPGLGTFLPHRNGTVRFQKEAPKKNG